MPDLEVRLRECFITVFPDVPPGEIATTALANTAQWDSTATVILVTVLEEQFGITIDPNDFPKLISYNSILEYLGARVQENPNGREG